MLDAMRRASSRVSSLATARSNKKVTLKFKAGLEEAGERPPASPSNEGRTYLTARLGATPCAKNCPRPRLGLPI